MLPRIIVYGLNGVGCRTLCLLRQQGVPVVGVHDEPVLQDMEVVVGPLQSTETLKRAGIETAQTLVITNSDDAVNLEILLQAKLLNPRIRVISRLFNLSLGDRLDCTLSDHTTLSVAALAAPIFAFAAMGELAIGHLNLFQKTWPISEVTIDYRHPWRGRKLNTLWEDPSRMLIHYLTSDIEISLVEAMNLNRDLEIGDRLIIGTKPQVHKSQVSWSTRLRKVLVWTSQFQRHLRSGLVITLVLLLIIGVATFSYVKFGWTQVSLLDSLYFSVGMITGAGGNEAVAEKAPMQLKLFTVIMMLVGAGVIGIFYALLNDLVLGTRLRQFWDATRVPYCDHYIVCGLGDVGVKIVNQLLSQGHEVIVIERDANNRFLSMVRAQRVPVLIADASLPQTLKAANIQQASALLAVTDLDMSNLEIALTAKACAAKLAIVVRINQSEQADRVRQVFDFTAVLTPSDIAAPSFAAAALGGRVFGNGTTGQILWIALSLLVTPAHPFCGCSVQSVAIAADLVPLYLQTDAQTIHGWELLNACLQPGDVLHLTIPAKNIERLWRTTNRSLQAG
ncbi:MAG TPA: NAD-binding protein [Stenomitos sp.]